MADRNALIECFRDTQRMIQEDPALHESALRAQAQTVLYLSGYEAIQPAEKSKGLTIEVLEDSRMDNSVYHLGMVVTLQQKLCHSGFVERTVYISVTPDECRQLLPYLRRSADEPLGSGITVIDLNPIASQSSTDITLARADTPSNPYLHSTSSMR